MTESMIRSEENDSQVQNRLVKKLSDGEADIKRAMPSRKRLIKKLSDSRTDTRETRRVRQLIIAINYRTAELIW